MQKCQKMEKWKKSQYGKKTENEKDVKFPLDDMGKFKKKKNSH